MLFGAKGSDAIAEIAGNKGVALLAPCYNEEAVIGKVAAGGLILDTVTRGRREFKILVRPARLASAEERPGS